MQNPHIRPSSHLGFNRKKKHFGLNHLNTKHPVMEIKIATVVSSWAYLLALEKEKWSVRIEMWKVNHWKLCRDKTYGLYISERMQFQSCTKVCVWTFFLMVLICDQPASALHSFFFYCEWGRTSTQTHLYAQTHHYHIMNAHTQCFGQQLDTIILE